MNDSVYSNGLLTVLIVTDVSILALSTYDLYWNHAQSTVGHHRSGRCGQNEHSFINHHTITSHVLLIDLLIKEK